MSCDGTIIGLPLEGDNILLVLIIKTLASSWASRLKGTCTAIWSPSKSALKAVQTNGCSWIDFPSIKIGSKAWIPSLWRVGALFKRTGCSRITSSKISHTLGSSFSTSFFAAFIVLAQPYISSLWKINGLKSSSAIFLGRPHWWSFRFGPTTITDLPE